jgi:hypothetical protein
MTRPRSWSAPLFLIAAECTAIQGATLREAVAGFCSNDADDASNGSDDTGEGHYCSTAMAAPKRHVFSAKIERLGAWYVIQVPAKVSKAFGKRGHLPVIAKVNGVELRRSMMPLKAGKHFLALNADLRKRARIDLGDRVKVSLMLDHSPPEAPIPMDLVFVLRDEDALAAFQGLSRSYKNHIIAWIEEAATAPTRDKRMARALEVALAAREKAIDSK